jgi:hypothetical protein
VKWVEHVTTGKRAPLDVTPTLAGNIALDEAGRYYIVPAQERTGDLYTSHFVTCDHAREWRTKAPKKGDTHAE